MKSILKPSESSTIKEKMFLAALKEVWKDIERAFGVLSIRFHILSVPFHLHNRVDKAYVMQACITMHNTIVEGRQNTYGRGMGGLQQFKATKKMFRRRSEFNW